MFRLPSQGFGTDLTDRIQVEKGSLDFLMYTSESVANDDYFPFIQAMQSMVPTIDINKLSIPDFFALVAYVRIKMFPKSPMEYSYTCRNTMFETPLGKMTAEQVNAAIAAKELDANEDLDICRCKTKNKVRVTSIDQLETINFDADGFDASRFDLPRVHLLAEWKRLMKEPKFRFVVPAIAWLKEGETLEEKMKIVNDDLDLFDELSKLNIDKAFGLRSRIVHQCTCCGKSGEFPLHVDNQSFLRM